MDDRDRARLIGGAYAHTVILRRLVTRAYPTDDVRRAQRKIVCDALETMFEEEGLTDHGSLVLHSALDEVEAIFSTAQPPREPTT